MSTYEISQSSLLSLKAEILRKREEVKKAELENRNKVPPPTKPLELKNRGVEERQQSDLIDEEEANLLARSRSALEAKARLYDKLSKRKKFTEEETERNRRFLVRFDKKNRKQVGPYISDGEEDDVDRYPEEDDGHHSDDYEPAKNPDEEWMEYTDCLGRTRKCMRKDLNYLKSKDKDLRDSIDKDENKAEQLRKPTEESTKTKDKEETESFNERSELLSNDMRRELSRQQWELEEEELRKKDDIHYQDILFSEARTHGVGYYGFSKDEEERVRQQEALNKLREETEQQQKKAQAIKALRDKQLAARAKAARNRKRLRMGLPPEEDEPEKPEVLEELNPKVGEDVKKKTKEEEDQDKKRKQHIRPWDIGKEGVREHYEHTQEEWVEKKRKERPQEFQPPSSYKRGFKSEAKRTYSDDDESSKSLYFSSKKDFKKNENKNTVNPYKTRENMEHYRNQSIPQPSAPIVNECEDDEEVQNRESTSNRGRGVEIAPPPTFDYYGPSKAKRSKPTVNSGNLQESISAGLKFLREQAEKKDDREDQPFKDMFLN